MRSFVPEDRTINLTLLLLGLCLLIVSGCGFHLRGSQFLPDFWPHMALVIPASAPELKQALDAYGRIEGRQTEIPQVKAPQETGVHGSNLEPTTSDPKHLKAGHSEPKLRFEITQVQFERFVLTYQAGNQAKNYEYRYSLAYRLVSLVAPERAPILGQVSTQMTQEHLLNTISQEYSEQEIRQRLAKEAVVQLMYQLQANTQVSALLAPVPTDQATP